VSQPAQSNSPWLDDDEIALNVPGLDATKRHGHGFVQSVDRDFVWKPYDDDAVVTSERNLSIFAKPTSAVRIVRS